MTDARHRAVTRRWVPGRGGRMTSGLLFLMLLLLPPLAVANAEDPPGIERFPGAEIAYHTPLGNSRTHAVPIDRITRVDGFMQPRTTRQVEGRRRSVTWGHPRGVSSAEVYQHLRRQLPGEAWYSCESRDCGPSTYWAHRQFGVADLYGGDGTQFYVAVPRPTAQGPVLTMLYVVQRGTREVMAHMEDILLEDVAVDAADPASLARSLLETGVVRLPVEFEDGTPGEAFERLLDVLEEAVTELPPRAELWFVVHLRDAGLGGRATLEAADERAAVLAEALAGRLPERTVEGLGVGALIPGVLRGEGVLVQLVVQQPQS